MSTEIEIANRALRAVGAKPIANMLNEQSDEAKLVNLLFAPTRDGMIRAAPWNFCRRVSQLTLLKSVPGVLNAVTDDAEAWNEDSMPAPPWTYEYAQPADCMMVRHVSGTPPYTVQAPYALGMSVGNSGEERTVILTDAANALVCYTARVQNAERWDASFVESMVYALASQMAVPLTAKQDLMVRYANMAANTLTQARVVNGNENPMQTRHTPDWIAARTGSISIAPRPVALTWSNPAFLSV